MKTLGRILIILVTFALVMGITYMAVNAVSSSTTARSIERGGEGFPQPEGVRSQFSKGQGPEFPGGEGRGRGGTIRWILGTVKNVGLIGITVALVVGLKDFLDKRKSTPQQATE